MLRPRNILQKDQDIAAVDGQGDMGTACCSQAEPGQKESMANPHGFIEGTSSVVM